MKDKKDRFYFKNVLAVIQLISRISLITFGVFALASCSDVNSEKEENKQFSFQKKVQASVLIADANLGDAVALDANTAVVGAKDEKIGNMNGVGAVYVFTRSGSTWNQQARLEAADKAADDGFGKSVAISGNTIVIGSPGKDDIGSSDAGAVYVFTRSGDKWSQQAMLRASDKSGDDRFGNSVAINGNSIVVGSPYEQDGSNSGSITDTGAVYVFTRNDNKWSQQVKLRASNSASEDRFGNSVAMSDNSIVVGAISKDSGSSLNVGAVYVFTGSGNKWDEQAILEPGDKVARGRFGQSVAISGNSIAVGASEVENSTGAAYVFTRSGDKWSQQARLQPSDKKVADLFGESIAINGDVMAVAAVGYSRKLPETGEAVYVFNRTGSNWKQQSKIQVKDNKANDQFGGSVAMVDGSVLIVGAPGVDDGKGAAYIFAK